MARFLGEGIDASVAEQIKARGTIMSRSPRNESDLKYLNQRTGWVRVTSGVNVLSEEEMVTIDSDIDKYGQVLTNVLGNSSKAKELILQGGTVRLEGESLAMRGGISFDRTGGSQNTYNTTDLFGTTPMTGITGFSIVSKNRFGTIRESTVDFRVESLEDLERVEKVFFRVGYSCIIEWGHSIYVKNNGTVENATNTSNYVKFFDNDSRDNFQEIITKQKVATDHNYDGLIGLITNFSWSFQAGGTYNCSIKVLSLGEVISSLRADRGMSDFDFLPGDSSEDENEESSIAIARKSPFHLLSYILDKVGDAAMPTREIDGATVKGGVLANADVINNLPLSKKDVESNALVSAINELVGLFGGTNDIANTQNFNGYLRTAYASIVYELTQEISKGGLGRGSETNNLFTGREYTTDRRWYWSDEKQNVFYMSLRTFLAFINRFYMLKVNDGEVLPRFYTDSKMINRDLPPDPQFKTYEGHFSADPWIVQVPQPAAGRQVNGMDVSSLRVGGIGGIQHNIYDLVISIPYIIEKLDPLVGGKDAEFNVLEFVKSVIDGLEAPLGGINDFDITYDEDSCQYAVIDRNNIVTSSNSLPVLDVTGIKTTLTDLTIETKISDKLVSTIAIAAQASPKGYGEILASQVAWNRGFVDRILTTKSQVDPRKLVADNEERKKGIADKEKEKKEKYLELLKKTYDKLNSTKSEYKIEDWNGLLPESIYYQTKAVNEKSPVPNYPLEGIVPVEVGFTLDGISGLKIGELFKISDYLLPTKYETFSYIVTGLEHSIDGGKWMSKIKANPIVYPEVSRKSPAEKPPPQVNTPTQSRVEPPEVLPSPAETSPATPEADRLRAVLSQLGYYEKGDELSNGGDITKETADMGIAVARKLKELIPGLKVTFTGGNDKFHQRLPYNSRHKRGTGLDFIITPQSAKNQVVDILQGFAAGSVPNFRYLNEYDNPTIAASGKHFHISWGPGTEAQSNLTLAQARAQRGEINTFSVT